MNLDDMRHLCRRETLVVTAKGEMQQGFTTFVTDTDDSCIVVRRVPCLQCENCGEIAYTGDVAENLEKIVKAAKQTLTEVAVVKYPGAVA